MKKSIKDQTVRAFQVGGYNAPVVPQATQPYGQPTQIDPQTGTYMLPGSGTVTRASTYQPTTGYTSYTGPTPYYQPVQFTDVQYQTAEQTTNLPTFGETVGTKPGQYDELRTYINDAGQTLQIPFKDGMPIYPIPEGYRPIGDQPEPEEQQTTVTPTIGQTQVYDEGGDERDKGYTIDGVNYGSFNEATEANANNFGATGNRGVDLAGVAAALGVPGAGFAVGKGFNVGETAPQQGMGQVSYADLTSLAGLSDDDYDRLGVGATTGLTPSQAQARLDALSNVGVFHDGYVGYNPGDAVPGMPGAVMGFDGISRSAVTGAVARDTNGVPAYRSFKDFYNRVTMTQEEKEQADKESKERADNISKSIEQAQSQAQIGGFTKADTTDASTGAPTSFGDPASKGGAEDSKGDVGFGRGEEGQGVEGGPGDPSPDGGMAGAGDVGAGTGTDCLTENMKVKLNGVIDFVTNIKVGDMIDGYIVKEVLHKHMRSGYFVINNELEITNDHPVWAKSGGLGKADWTRPEQLVVGDTISGVKVTSLNYIDRMTPTVSIVIDGDSFDVYTEGNTYTVHGRYREVRQQAA